MDRLSGLFSRFAPSARVFDAGTLCQLSTMGESDGFGHLHLLRAGELLVTRGGADQQRITEPSVIFSPRPQAHSLAPMHVPREWLLADAR